LLELAVEIADLTFQLLDADFLVSGNQVVLAARGRWKRRFREGPPIPPGLTERASRGRRYQAGDQLLVFLDATGPRYTLQRDGL
jgi:hypothetical protein